MKEACSSCFNAPATVKVRLVRGGTWTSMCRPCAKGYQQSGAEVSRERRIR